MNVAGKNTLARLALSMLFAAAALLSGEAFAQNSNWAPTRTAAGQAAPTVEYATPAMHSSAVRSMTSNDNGAGRPEWQQSPAGQQTAAQQETEAPSTAVRASMNGNGMNGNATTGRSPAASRSKPAPATQSQATHFHSVPSRAPAGRTTTTTRADGRLVAHQSASQSGQQTLNDYNIRLSDGEQLVGQPKITENGPLNAQGNVQGNYQANNTQGGQWIDRGNVRGNSPGNVQYANGQSANSQYTNNQTANGQYNDRPSFRVVQAKAQNLQGPAPRSAAGSVRSEMIPVPDNVSTGRGSAGNGSMNGGSMNGGGRISGPIFNEDGTEYHGPITQDGQTIMQGDVELDPDFNAFDNDGQGGCASCTSGNCNGSCGQDEWGDPSRCPECGMYGHHMIGCGQVARCLQNCLGFLFREASVFGGTQGFKGPLDLGVNGNFGFNEGFNLAGALIPFPKYGLGYQVGARWAQSDLSGNVFGSAAREQAFVTAGVFHRAYRGCGFQWGAAFDWTTDNYYTKATYSQIRLETSWLTSRGHEFGFWGVVGGQSDQVTFNVLNIAVNQSIKPTDQYNFFYRYTTKYGGQGRFWGGWTGQNLTVIGSDFRVPMSNRTDLVGGFNYIMPPAGQNNGGTGQESWGLAMNIVWYFGRAREGIHNTPYRPLFQVADNNVMMIDRP